MLRILIIAGILSSSVYANGNLERAYEKYLARGYDQAGIKNADSARYNFGKVAEKLFTTEGEFARARNLQAGHFLYSADPKNKDFYLQDAMGHAARGVFYFQKTFGNNPFKNSKITERERKIYADLLIWRGEINAISLEWKNINSDMKMLIALGYGCMNDGGAYRLLGMKEKAGGNLNAAAALFKNAFGCTQIPTGNGNIDVNWNGLNVLNYADLLWNSGSIGNKEKSVQILKQFIATPVEMLSLDFVPENRKLQKIAADKLKSWGQIKSSEFIAGEFVAKLKKGFSAPKVVPGFKIKERISNDLLVLKSVSEGIMRAELAILKAHASFLIVEPNYIFHSSVVPNDPSLSSTWGIKNYGQPDSMGTKGLNGVDARAEKAWDITTGNRETIVAVIDTGIDFRAPDLKDNAWVNEVELNGKVGLDDDGNGFIDDINGFDFFNNTGKMVDDNGHGTHVAGVIGARGDDGIGIAGINWNVRLMALKFLDANGGGSLAGAIKAIRYAAQMKAKISNNSWGGGEKSEILRQTINEAGDQGHLFVAAAGNSSSNMDVLPEYPGSYNLPNMISVAAINNRGRLANFSNYAAQTVHLGAPGENIYSTLPGGVYDSWSGTSMASPFVAGAAALLWGHEPGLTMKEVKERLLLTAAPIASLRGKTITGGMVDVYAALTNGSPVPDPHDPDKWESTRWSLASEHNYKNNLQQTFTFKIPDAKAIAIYLKQFQLEDGYDKMFFTDAQNNLLGVWTGKHNGEFSPIADGNTIYMNFFTDSMISDFGFEIDKVMHQ